VARSRTKGYRPTKGADRLLYFRACAEQSAGGVSEQGRSMKTVACVVAVVCALIAASCGSSSKSTCTSGASVSCSGPGGCTGGQVCNSDGTSFSACECGGAGTSSGSSGGNPSSGAGSGATSSGGSSSSGGPSSGGSDDASGCALVLATNYDQSCSKGTDCVVAYEEFGCGMCVVAAINASAQSQYEADSTKGLRDFCYDAIYPPPFVCCVAGVCQSGSVCFPDGSATGAACAAAGGHCQTGGCYPAEPASAQDCYPGSGPLSTCCFAPAGDGG
jgi:hypothetical protein